jgi:hypothetical protein
VCDENEKHPLREDRRRKLTKLIMDMDNSVAGQFVRIKAIKAANSIEVTPQRDRQKHSTAEEPITARIRRRKEAIPASESTMAVDDASGAVPVVPSASTQNSSTEPPMTFQERIARERQRRDREPILS